MPGAVMLETEQSAVDEAAAAAAECCPYPACVLAQRLARQSCLTVS